MMDRPLIVIGGIVGLLIVAAIAAVAMSGTASIISFSYYALLAIILIACPLAIVGGAFWLARRILRGTGSGGYY